MDYIFLRANFKRSLKCLLMLLQNSWIISPETKMIPPVCSLGARKCCGKFFWCLICTASAVQIEHQICDYSTEFPKDPINSERTIKR